MNRVRRSMWSSTRPGVPTTISTPRLRALQLPLDRLAAIDAANRHIAALAELLELHDDLLDELAGGGQDDGLRAARPRLHHLDQGNPERGRLAGARLGLPDDVQPVEGLRDECGLDGGGLGVAGV